MNKKDIKIKTAQFQFDKAQMILVDTPSPSRENESSQEQQSKITSYQHDIGSPDFLESRQIFSGGSFNTRKKIGDNTTIAQTTNDYDTTASGSKRFPPTAQSSRNQFGPMTPIVPYDYTVRQTLTREQDSRPQHQLPNQINLFSSRFAKKDFNETNYQIFMKAPQVQQRNSRDKSPSIKHNALTPRYPRTNQILPTTPNHMNMEMPKDSTITPLIFQQRQRNMVSQTPRIMQAVNTFYFSRGNINMSRNEKKKRLHPETPGGNCTDLLEFKNKETRNKIYSKKENVLNKKELTSNFDISTITSQRSKELFEQQQFRNQVILKSNAKNQQVIQKFNKQLANKNKNDIEFTMDQLDNVQNLYMKRNIPKESRGIRQRQEMMKLEDRINAISYNDQLKYKLSLQNKNMQLNQIHSTTKRSFSLKSRPSIVSRKNKEVELQEEDLEEIKERVENAKIELQNKLLKREAKLIKPDIMPKVEEFMQFDETQNKGKSMSIQPLTAQAKKRKKIMKLTFSKEHLTNLLDTPIQDESFPSKKNKLLSQQTSSNENGFCVQCNYDESMQHNLSRNHHMPVLNKRLNLNPYSSVNPFNKDALRTDNVKIRILNDSQNNFQGASFQTTDGKRYSKDMPGSLQDAIDPMSKSILELNNLDVNFQPLKCSLFENNPVQAEIDKTVKVAKMQSHYKMFQSDLQHGLRKQITKQKLNTQRNSINLQNYSNFNSCQNSLEEASFLERIADSPTHLKVQIPAKPLSPQTEATPLYLQYPENESCPTLNSEENLQELSKHYDTTQSVSNEFNTQLNALGEPIMQNTIIANCTKHHSAATEEQMKLPAGVFAKFKQKIKKIRGEEESREETSPDTFHQNRQGVDKSIDNQRDSILSENNAPMQRIKKLFIGQVNAEKSLTEFTQGTSYNPYRTNMVSAISQSLQQEQQSEIERMRNSSTISKKEMDLKMMGSGSHLTEIENCFLEITMDLLQKETQKKEYVDLLRQMLTEQDNELSEQDFSPKYVQLLCKSVDPKVLHYKMQKSIQLFDEAKFYLKQLFKDEKHFHQKIKVEPYGAATKVQLMSSFKWPMYIEIPAGACSPLVLKFRRNDQNGQPIDEQIENITLYGSFKTKRPNFRDHEVYERNPKKLSIAEPSEKKAKCFTAKRRFYILLESINDEMRHIQINSYVKLPEEGEESVDVELQEAKKEEYGRKTIQPEHRSEKGQLGHTLDYKKYMKKIIEEQIDGNHRECWAIIDRMAMLKKKSKILNFISKQFGSSNPLCHVRNYIEDLNNDEPIKPENIPMCKSIRLDSKIKCNISNASLTSKREDASADVIHNYSCYDNKQEVAEKNRKELEIQKRLHQKHDMKRWDVFRAKRDVAIQKFTKVRLRIQICKDQVKLCLLNRAVNYIWTIFYETKCKIEARKRVISVLNKYSSLLKQSQRRKGPDLVTRTHRRLNIAMTYLGVQGFELQKRRCVRECLLLFLREGGYRGSLQRKFVHTCISVRFIQSQFSKANRQQEEQITYLEKMWWDEFNQVNFYINQHGKSNPVLLDFMKAVTAIPDDLRQACFRRYLNACKMRHSLAFFQWRKKYSVSQQKDQLEEIFLARLEKMRSIAERQSIIILNDAQFSSRKSNLIKLEKEKTLRQTPENVNRKNSVTPLSGESRDVQSPATPKQRLYNEQDNIYDKYEQDDCLGNKYYCKDRYGIDIFPNPSKRNISQIQSVRGKIGKVKKVDIPKHVGCSPLNHDFRDLENKQCINTFEEINMIDLFPEADPNSHLVKQLAYKVLYEEAGSIDDGYVYDSCHFNRKGPPPFIYKPSNVIMRKMMRACASCNEYSDLYFLM